MKDLTFGNAWLNEFDGREFAVRNVYVDGALVATLSKPTRLNGRNDAIFVSFTHSWNVGTGRGFNDDGRFDYDAGSELQAMRAARAWILQYADRH
jgi:hypothetical protein